MIDLLVSAHQLTLMGSPQVSIASVKELVGTTEREVEIEPTGVAESSTLLYERQLNKNYASHSDNHSDTEQSVTSNSMSPNHNQNIVQRNHHQNCESVKKFDETGSQQATTDDQNRVVESQSGTSNTIGCYSGNSTTRPAHKRLRLQKSWCLSCALFYDL